MIPPKIIIDGDPQIASSIMGFAKNSLIKLQRDMRFQGLNESFRVLHPFPGIIVECWSSFSLQTIKIIVAPGVVLVGEDQPEPEIDKQEFLKLFVHVDVVGQEDWPKDESDYLVRSDVTSAIAMGLVDISSASLLTSEVLSTEYLTVHSDSSVWYGVEGGEAADLNEELEWYNNMFDLGESSLPPIETEWIADTVISGLWQANATYPQGDRLDSSYRCGAANCELVTEALSNWCNDALYVYTSDYTDAVTAFKNIYLSDADRVKYTYDLTESCSHLSYCYDDHYPWGYNYPYNPDSHDHSFATGNTTNYGYIKRIFYGVHQHPILGTTWDFVYRQAYFDYWTDNSESPYTYYRHNLYNAMRDFREAGVVSTGIHFPYKDPPTYNEFSFLYDVGQDLRTNYILEDDFRWYQATVGGILEIDDHYTINSVIEGGTVNCRSLFNLCAAYGYGVNPFQGQSSAGMDSILAQLAKEAIIQAGGTIYDSSELPEIEFSDARDTIIENVNVNENVLTNAPGFLYSSPLLNIKVYCIPVDISETEEIL